MKEPRPEQKNACGWRSVVSCVLLVVASCAASADAQTWPAAWQWTGGPVGPALPSIANIAIDPNAANTIYAGTNGSGLFKSTDGGASWARLAMPIDANILSIAVDPIHSSVLYVSVFVNATSVGVMKSADGGATWTTFGSLPTSTVRALVVDAVNPAVVYAGYSGLGVYKTTTGGSSWTPANAGLSNPGVLALAADPTASSTLYAGTSGGVFKTTNGATAWTASSSGLTSTFIRSLAVAPSAPSTVYAGTNAGPFVSLDAGATWTAAGTQLGARVVYALAVSRLDPRVVFAGTDTGVYKSADGGATWLALNQGLDASGVGALTIDPSADETVFAGQNGVSKSVNGGQSWQLASGGMETSQVWSLAFDPNHALRLYAGMNGGIFSRDAEGAWQSRSSGFPTSTAQSLAFVPSQPGTIYAASFCGGVFKTTNDGASWAAVNTGITTLCAQSVAVDPAQASTVYAATNDGVFKTTNAGASWTSIVSGLTPTAGTRRDIPVLAIDPVTPSTVYAGGTVPNGLFKTTNGGASWTPLGAAPTANQVYVTALIVDPANPATIYMGADAVYRSTDGGATWAVLGLQNRLVRSMLLAPGSQTLYVGVNDVAGVYRTGDGGATWTLFDAGLPAVAPYALALEPTVGNRLYLGSGGHGAYVSSLNPLPDVVLVAPNGTIVLGGKPSYSWSAASGATRYEVWVADSTGATKVDTVYTAAEAACSPGAGQCTVTPDIALAAGAATWKVRAGTASDWGAWSTVSSFSVYTTATAPAKVTLISPNGAHGGQYPAFTWNAVPGATWYYVRIDDASASGKVMAWYTAVDADCGMGTGTCSISPGQIAVGDGVWKVMTWNDYGYGPVSDSIRFTIVTTPPAKPTLVSPSGAISTTMPAYVWQAVPAATEYYLRVANMDANPVNHVSASYTAAAAGCAAGTGTCSVTPTTELPVGQKRWWVSANNANGTGPASETGLFTVNLNSVPGPVVTVSPTGTVTTTTPAFTWNAATNATWYYLRVVDASGTAKVGTWYTAAQVGCATGSTCSVTPSVPLAIGAATWKVKPWNDSGDGPISDEVAFTVAPSLAPTLVSPTGTVNTATPTYSWTAVSGTTWYYVWVDDSSGTGKVSTWYRAQDVGCGGGTGNCSVTPAVALASGAASWKVQTWGGWGYGPWTSATNFTVSVQNGLPAKPTLVSPTGSITTTTPTYTWNAASGATWYYLWVADSSGAVRGVWYTSAQTGCAAGTGTCSVTPSTPLATGAASWKVKPWNDAGDGPISDPMTFTVAQSYATTLLAPTGTIGNLPTYSWKAVPGTTWYYLLVDDSSGAGKIDVWYRASDVNCPAGTGNCSVTPSTPLAAGAGSWKVQTWGAWGYGPWSSALSFIVQ